MKKPKRAHTSAITEMGHDLGRHLKDRIYQVLDDFRDTAEIGGLERVQVPAIMIAVLLDIAIVGMLNTLRDADDIEDVINSRLRMACENRKEKSNERRR